MTAELLVNVTPSETEWRILMAVFCRKFILNVRRARNSRQYLQGSCKSCTSGYAAAFVDIGLDKAAFLHASDIIRTPNVWRVKNKSNSRCATSRTGSSGARSDGAGGERSAWHKGARLTTDITLPSRYLVFMPGLLTLGFPNVLKANQNVNA